MMKLKNCLVILYVLITSSYSWSQDAKSVSVFWDTSISISQELANHNIKVLDDFVQENPNLTVELVTFSNVRNGAESFSIANGDWDNLKNRLTTVLYDGSTSYTFFDNEKVISSEALIFTDGYESLTNTKIKLDVPTTIFCSDKDCVKKMLSKTSFKIRIKNTNFQETEIVNIAKTRTEISGKIRDSYGELEKVTVLNLNTGESTLTDEEGVYALNVFPTDTLSYTYNNIVVSKLEVKDVAAIYDANLSGKNLLKEVFLEKRIVKETQSEEILVGDKSVNKRSLGYDVRVLGEEEIASNNVNLGTALKGKVAGVEVGNNNDIAATIIRGYSSFVGNNHPLIIIDGVPLPRSQLDVQSDGTIGGGGALGAIDPNNIKSVSVLKGLAATNRYGGEGSSGVILITTKTGSHSKTKASKVIPVGTTDTYQGDVAVFETSINPILETIKINTDLKDAYATYHKVKQETSFEVRDFIDVADHFGKWNDAAVVKKILSSGVEVAENSKDLRELSYEYEKNGYYNEAILIHKYLIKQDANNLQSYLDIAKLYDRNGDADKALESFLECQNQVINKSGQNLESFEKALLIDFGGFYQREKSNINFSKVDNRFKSGKEIFKRVTIQWSDFESQFHLQVVNPQDRFFTWEHTEKAEGSRINSEMTNGYGIEDYFLTAEDKGTWIFNVENLNSNLFSKKELVLKITVYNNFGSARQTVEETVLRLQPNAKNATISKITI